jgi:hypothetical protein
MDPVILCGAIVTAQQIVAASSLIFDNMPTLHEVRVDKKRRREAAPYKCNVSMGHRRQCSNLCMFWTVFLTEMHFSEYF